MYAAVLLVCLLPLGGGPSCFGLEDKHGPYETEAACEDRLVEMWVTVDQRLRETGFAGNAKVRKICKPLKKEMAL